MSATISKNINDENIEIAILAYVAAYPVKWPKKQEFPRALFKDFF